MVGCRDVAINPGGLVRSCPRVASPAAGHELQRRIPNFPALGVAWYPPVVIGQSD